MKRTGGSAHYPPCALAQLSCIFIYMGVYGRTWSSTPLGFVFSCLFTYFHVFWWSSTLFEGTRRPSRVYFRIVEGTRGPMRVYFRFCGLRRLLWCRWARAGLKGRFEQHLQLPIAPPRGLICQYKCAVAWCWNFEIWPRRGPRNSVMLLCYFAPRLN